MADTLSDLKILIVGPVPPPAGGMANQTRQLQILLQSEGADVNLVAVNKPYSPNWIGKIPVLRALFRLFPYIWALFQQVRKADVVHMMANSGWSWHLFSAPAIWIAWILNKPLLVNYRGGHAEAFFKKSFHWVRPSLNRSKGIIVPSSYLQDVFGQWGKRAEVVPNVLNEERFYALSNEYKGIDKDNSLHLIVTRNLEQIYDLPTAIRCLKRLKEDYPKARLSIAGSGPERDALEKLVAELNLTESVSFLGRLEADDIAQLYRSADLMLNPSTVDNSPNSVIEAMACGIPVVSTNVGGIPKLIKHEWDGLMVAPRQPEAMRSQVKRVIDDPGLANFLVKNALQTVQKFHWENVRLKLQHHYFCAIEGQGH